MEIQTYKKKSILIFLLGLSAPGIIEAYQKFQCTEIDRISVSPKGQMEPAYPGRIVDIEVFDSSLYANGIFFVKDYSIKFLENGEIQGSGQSIDRNEMFHFHNGLLFHTAIVTNQNSKVIQSQILSCIDK